MTDIAIAVVECDGQFLIGERPEGAPLAGYWEFPGGKVEPGESPREAAARECHEETGLEVIVGDEYPEVIHEYDHGKLRLHFFHASPSEFAQPTSSRFHWVSRQQLADYKFPEANDALLALLLDSSEERPRDAKFWLGPAHALSVLVFAYLLMTYERRAGVAAALVIAVLGFVLLGMSVVNKTVLGDSQFGPRQIFFDLTAICVTCVFAQAIGWPAFLVWIPLILLRRL